MNRKIYTKCKLKNENYIQKKTKILKAGENRKKYIGPTEKIKKCTLKSR